MKTSENGLQFQDNDDRILIASCTSGLCNRLYCLAGSVILARNLNRQLRIHWPHNQQLSVGLGDIFSSGPGQDLIISDQELLLKLTRPECLSKTYNCWPDRSLGDFSDYVELNDPHEVVLVKSWHVPSWVKGRPSYDDIRDIILGWNLVHDRQYAAQVDHQDVGVHIRLGDRDDTGRITPHPSFSKSTLGAFHEAMDAVLEAWPGTRFFVSTPSHYVADELQYRYGCHNVIYGTGATINNRGKTGALTAINDLLALSRTRFILSSHNSQFSWMASLIGQVPSFVVGVDRINNIKQIVQTEYEPKN